MCVGSTRGVIVGAGSHSPVGARGDRRNSARATFACSCGGRVHPSRSPSWAGELGLAVDEAPLAALAEIDDADLVISTLPGTADLDVVPNRALVSAAPLLDVAYDPWPTALGASWLEGGGRVVHGLGMLLHQALLQVRIFVNGDPNTPLDDDDGVLAVMRDALR